MPCDFITPQERKRIKALIKKTRDSGFEWGFSKCNDGLISKDVVGKKDSIKLSKCDENLDIDYTLHIHPERRGALTEFPSGGDLLHASITKSKECIGFSRGKEQFVRCVDGKKMDSKVVLDEMKERDELNLRSRLASTMLFMTMQGGKSEARIQKLQDDADNLVRAVKQIGEAKWKKYKICEINV